MKFLFDIFPVVLFFVAFKLYDIYVATAVAIAATFVQIGWLWLRGPQGRQHAVDEPRGDHGLRRRDARCSQDETFIKWKPTVLYWLFAGVLAVGALGVPEEPDPRDDGAPGEPARRVWSRLLASWIGFFVVMGALNLYVAYNFSTDAWVNFKLFGGIGLMLVFVLLQALMLAQVRPGQERARIDGRRAELHPRAGSPRSRPNRSTIEDESAQHAGHEGAQAAAGTTGSYRIAARSPASRCRRAIAWSTTRSAR